MELVEVDVVGLQAAQAGLALLDDVASAVASGIGILGVHLAVDLGREDNVVPLSVALQGFAGDFLAPAQRVDVGRVEEVDPGVEGAVDDRV